MFPGERIKVFTKRKALKIPCILLFVLGPSLQASTMLLFISACCQLFSISTAAGRLITSRLSRKRQAQLLTVAASKEIR